MAARLGVQIEFVTNVLSNRMPSRARRSMFGVVFTREPYAPIAWAAWSSDMMKMMFGRSAAEAGPARTASRSVKRVRRMVQILDRDGTMYNRSQRAMAP